MWSETLKLALSSIIEHRLRSLLTVLGIVFGVMAVIATVAIVQGVFALFLMQLDALGAGFLFAVAGNAQSKDRVRLEARLTSDDAVDVARQCPSVEATTPYLAEPLRVKRSDRTSSAVVAAVTAQFPDIQGVNVQEGRFFSATDVVRRSQVAVIGAGVQQDLGLSGPGDTVRVLNKSYTIVGVLEQRDGFNALGQRFDQMILVPLTTIPSQGNPSRGGVMLIRLKNSDDVDAAKHEVRLALRRAHRLGAGEPDDFTLITQGEVLDNVQSVTSTATWVVMAIVGVSLLVGGIGIMNIMLVSVRERTREIGVRMALGARRNDVMMQFLIEASTLGAIGGAIGVVLGIAVSYLVAGLVELLPSPQVPLWSVLLALSFSAATGLFFGLYPAARAARLDPIEALRDE